MSRSCKRISRIETPTNLQPPYSMLRPEIEQEILPFCLAHNIGVIPYSPMQSGLLTGTMTRERFASLPEGDWRRNNRFFQEPMFCRRRVSLVELSARDRREARPHARARWRLPGRCAIPAITATIVGARNPQQIDELIGAATFRLSPQEIEELDAALTFEAAKRSPGGTTGTRQHEGAVRRSVTNAFRAFVMSTSVRPTA